MNDIEDVTVLEEERDGIACLEMRADKLMRHIISGELANYRVVRSSPEPLQKTMTVAQVWLLANVLPSAKSVRARLTATRERSQHRGSAPRPSPLDPSPA
jgi:hypothetical protein